MSRWVVQAFGLVSAGQWTVAQLTAAYLARVEGIREGVRVPAEAVSRDAVTGRGVRDVDPLVEWRRPAITVYTALAAGLSLRESVNRGLVRALDLAQVDIQLARTHTVAGSTRVSQFRRTLSGLENCDLCAVASTHRYYRGDLMPIHNKCDCGVMPVFSGDEMPERSDEGVTVRVHGEIGPVLTHAGHDFTGPDDF